MQPNLQFLDHGGEMARHIRGHDWSKTSLGPLADWPQTLKTSVNIILQSPVAIVMLWGEDGIMIYNDAYSVFAGAKHPVLLGTEVIEGWPEVADFNKNVMKVGLGGGTLSYKRQQLVLHRNGVAEDVWLDLDYSPIMDENGIPTGVLAIVTDATPQVLIEQKSKIAAQLATDILESTGDAVFMLDADWKIVAVNKVHETVTHTKRREILGKYFWDVFPSGPESKYWIEHHKVMSSRRSSHFDEYYEPLDLWTETNVYPTRNGGISVFFRDITPRKRAEAALHQQLSITEAITNNATACLLMVDHHGLVTYMNPAAIKVTGYQPDEAIGKSMHSLVHHSYPDGQPYPETDCPLVGAYKYGEPSPTHEDIFFHKDGSPFPAMITGLPVKANGSTRSTIVEFRDITDEKKAQQEQERLVSITHQRNELIKLNNAKDEFIALASHQLRTPATAVKQYISLVKDIIEAPLDAEQRQFLEIAYDSNERQLKIISDLLKTAQIDSNRYTLTKEPIVIADLLQSVIDDLQPALKLQNQQIAFDSRDNSVKLAVDRTEIQLVFMNLLENAGKYSHPGSTIDVSSYKQNGKLIIEVRDKGVGISQQNLTRIFEKFTRIDNELSDTVTGTGLGLYWAKRIIKLHGGTLRVQSVVGQGSTFTVTLPL